MSGLCLVNLCAENRTKALESTVVINALPCIMGRDPECDRLIDDRMPVRHRHKICRGDGQMPCGRRRCILRSWLIPRAYCGAGANSIQRALGGEP